MTDSPTVRLTAVGTVFAPVADQDRAIAFYVDVLGFELRVDASYGGGHRWVEVAPADSSVALALVPPTEGRAATTDRTLCALASADLDADHAALLAHGVDVDPVVGRAGTSRPGLVSTSITVPDPSPPQCCFRDPDGNRFLLVGAA
jgi:catechol 2,3-dioxygenase-like lactoylglutathione lyase family enzyme